MIIVSGIFDSRSRAEHALEVLRSIDIDDQQLALLAPVIAEAEMEKTVPLRETEQPGTGERIGSAMGRGLGALGGMMIGAAVGSFFVPGIGPVFIAGVLGATLLGTGAAAIGAAAGEAFDGQITKHRWHEELHIYEDALRRGNPVILVLAGDEKQAEMVHSVLGNAGASSFVEARETWWSGLRVTEEKEYARSGGDFASDEELFRKGFEAAQHPAWRGKSFADASEQLRLRYAIEYQRDAFQRGYERGLAYYQEVMEKYPTEPKRE